MAHEALYHSMHMGIRTAFTDHSLFALDDAVGILTNKLLAGALLNVDATICVSYTGYVRYCKSGILADVMFPPGARIQFCERC